VFLGSKQKAGKRFGSTKVLGAGILLSQSTRVDFLSGTKEVYLEYMRDPPRGDIRRRDIGGSVCGPPPVAPGDLLRSDG
jgi:hypothetical protein